MDLRLSAEDQALQDEVRAFVRREWHPLRDRYNWDDVGHFSPLHGDDEALAAQRQFAKKLVAKDWYTMHWPEEYGGRAVSIETQLAFREALAYEGAPATLGGGAVVSVLMLQGTDWQKREFLPKIANADIDFAQGFSEPNAGSDVANVQTRAVRDGDEYVITGEKVWTGGAHYSEWYHALVRTDPDAPSHRGISYVLIPLRDDRGELTPGIRLRPLYDMTGTRRWSEVFLDDVRIPVRNLIGEENRGWYAAMNVRGGAAPLTSYPPPETTPARPAAMTTLTFERSGIEVPARWLGLLDEFVSACRQLTSNSTPLLADPIVRHRLADLRVELEARRTLSYRVAWMQSKGQLPAKEAAMNKVWGDALGKKIPSLIASILQEYGRLGLGDPRAPLGGYPGDWYVSMHGSGIGAGTTEIWRNILAQRGLGLPR